MKRLLFLLLGLTIAVGATADVNFWQDLKPAKKQPTGQMFKERFKSQARTHTATSAPQLRSATTPINDPQGEERYYRRSGQCIRWTNINDVWLPIVTDQDGVIKIVYDPDGETVYIQNPISGIYGYTTWAVGTIQGNKIHVPMGQVLLHIEDDDFDGLLEWGTAVAQGNTFGFVHDTTVTEATFTINGDNISLDNSSGGVNGDGAVGIAVMYTNDNHMEGLEWGTEYTHITIPTIIYDQPEGELVTYQHSCSYYDFGYKEVMTDVSVTNMVYAPDGETVYLQFYIRGPWYTATISGNKIHMPLGQYNYYDAYEGYGELFAWGTTAAAPDGDGAIFVEDKSVTEVTYTINDNVITMDNSDGGVDGIGAVGLALITDDGSDYYYLEWGTEFTVLEAPEVIWEQPEGQLVTYTRHHQGIIYYENEVEEFTQDFNVVYAPDGQTAYVQDPVGMIPSETWVEGTVSGNKITVPLGQFVYYEIGLGVKIVWGTNSQSDGYYVFRPDNSVTEVTFTIGDDGYVTIDNSNAGLNGNGATGIALVDLESGYYAMEWNAPELQPITEQPEGQLEQYVRHGNWIYESGSVVPIGGLIDIVFAPDKQTVYIKDPIYDSQNGTWVKGTLESGTITVPIGQILSNTGGNNIVLAWGKMALNTTTWRYTFTPLSDKTAIQYRIYDDAIYMIDGWQDGSAYYGIAAMQEETGYSRGVEYESYYIYYDGPSVITEQPAGELVTYMRTGSAFYSEGGLNKNANGNRYINADQIKYQNDVASVVYAPDGQTVYLQDPVYCGFWYNRGTWVKGTLSADGTKITVPLGQFVTWDFNNSRGDQLVWGSTSLYDAYPDDEYNDYNIEFTPDNTVTEVTYTIQNGCISLDNSTGGSAEAYEEFQNQYYNGVIDQYTFEELVRPLYQTSGLALVDMDGNWTGESNWGTLYIGKHPATLPDPEINRWYDAQNENGNSRLDVVMPTVDTDGLPIFEDALSYSIYTDYDEVYTFEASRYGLDEDVTEVTYDMWQDSWRLQPSAGVRFFRTNAEGYEPFFIWRIGIQFHYTIDGVKNSTNIVYLEVFDEPEDPVKPGDANGDGTVSIGDVTSIIDALLSNDLDVLNRLNADVNNDGFITIGDVTALIDMLLSNTGGN